ncbi:hypothetical protein D3C78_1649470 [compost metagenome]
MLINPINKAIIPISFKHIFTAVQQVSIIPSSFKGFVGSSALPMIIQLKISLCPKKKHFMPATTIATIIKADQILLNAIKYDLVKALNLKF